MSIQGLEIFRKWYEQSNMGSPLWNVWQYNLGKLVVPIIFFDVDLFLVLAKRDDPITKEITDLEGETLIKISVDEIRFVFDLK